MTEREQFEAWAVSALRQDAKRWPNHEGYVYLQSEWLSWQASRKQALEEAARTAECYDLGTVEGHEIADCIRRSLTTQPSKD